MREVWLLLSPFRQKANLPQRQKKVNLDFLTFFDAILPNALISNQLIFPVFFPLLVLVVC